MEIFKHSAVVIGSGAAGFATACRLKEQGFDDVVIVTEGVNKGTSRNTGSDKQTYYKLGISGNFPDSVGKMAHDLFSGGCVDGDNALCEAALSLRAFMYLCELGVEFPTDRYGQYIGYKTDHDPCERATSAGPLTSKQMTECLEKRASKLNVKIYDNMLGAEILKDSNGGVCGLLALNTESGELCAFNCSNIVIASGGPAGIYMDSVYPTCHSGSSGLAIMVGAEFQNVTEWQYGLASVNPRWNVSGTYMQVLPRVISIDENGIEREFLAEFFKDEYKAISTLFLKGYQWPFDCKKVLSGSSVIDILVYRECVMKGRRVYLDYTKNPFGIHEIDFARLSGECHTYLKNADACFGTPIQRLEKMNMPAIQLYKSKGVDISKEYLEIALCAQHNNGGIAVNKWWESSVSGLFAVGECAGTHGVARPGGSALNAGQVGALRASQYISLHPRQLMSDYEFEKKLFASNTLCIFRENLNIDLDLMISSAQKRMSFAGSAIRVKEKLESAFSECENDLGLISHLYPHTAKKEELVKYFKLRDILVTQSLYLKAMINYAKTVGASRGSCICQDEMGELRDGLEECFRFALADGSFALKIQCICKIDKEYTIRWRDVREIPNEDTFFENVWSTYRQNKNIF